MTIKPIRDQVLIRSLDSFTDASGLVLPDAYDDDAHGDNGDFIRERNQLCLGEVLATGPGWSYDASGPVPVDVVPGERVMYNRADARRVPGDDKTLVLVRQHAIFLRVDSPARQVVGGLVSV